MSAIFISHSSRDNEIAVELAKRLAGQNHHSVFLDLDPEKGIVAGQSWERTLYRKLRACKAVIALCTDNYLSSHWCFAEIALQGLRNGEGMGMAKPAELNGYPGPKHVLELADELQLSPGQRSRIEEIRAALLSEAVRIGERIVEAEATLNRRFAHGHIDEAGLKEMTAQIAGLYGELRYAHLAAHLATKAALTAEQVEAYDRARGYSAGGDGRDR